MLYRDIESSADHDKLQEDLLQLEEWAATWQMNFAPSKCYTMSITLKRQPSSYSYTLCNTPLEGVTFQKYLGVYINNSLTWSKQAVEVKKKANKIQGVLQRNLVSFSPAVKSCCQVPGLSSVRIRLRRLATITKRRQLRRICPAPCGTLCLQRLSSYCGSVDSMISNLEWQDLETRRGISDLTMFFKIRTGNVKISFPQ